MQRIIQLRAFHSALIHGAYKVEGRREELNQYNGFPVPDRDTGSNLAYLMQHVRKNLPTASSYQELLTKLSEVSLTGARGNSGAIFSQFFSGFAETASMQKKEESGLSFSTLAAMFKAGYTSAYHSIQNPREGTILSAMSGFSEAFQRKLAAGSDIKDSVADALSTLKDVVKQSATILPQQRAMHAPDAGAVAFLYFAEGFMYSLLGIEKEESVELTFPEGTLHADNAIEVEALAESPYRFCTEALLQLKEGVHLGHAEKEALTAYGDSLVVSQAGSMARIHVHTNAPAAVIDMLEQYGSLREVKADDMQMQQALSRPHPGKIAFVTDSIADVPEEMLGEDVYILPMHLLAEGVSYQDKRNVSMDRVHRLSGKLSSSQLNRSEVEAFMEPIAKQYDEILIMTVSSKMSGLHARFVEYVASDVQAKVRLVNSKVNSGAQGLLALHAARRIKEGASLDAVADELEALREKAKIFVSLPNLKAMVNSGRLKGRIGAVLQAVGFLPLITIDKAGEGAVTGFSFSRKRSDRLLLKKLHAGEIASYAVVHVDDEERAQRAAEAIEQKLGMPPEYICDISAVVANFSGKSSYAVAFIRK